MSITFTYFSRATARIASAVALALLLTTVAMAQEGLTSIQGRVTDPSGAVIPGVTVTVTNTATAAVRQVITEDNGIYSATQLSPGTYNLKAELPGFKTQELTNVPLTVGDVITRNFALEVGAVSDVVEVNSSAVTVNVENAQIGNNFETKQIIDLPLNARNIVSLLSLQNGVLDDGSVNGARSDQQNITLDGVDVNMQTGATLYTQNANNTTTAAFTASLPTTLDSVQEFVVQTSGQGASASRSGGQVQLVTKSGSNQFHGSLYEAYRSKVTTATPYFNGHPNDITGGSAAPKPGLIRNIPGGSVGGPIIKNKLFFFGAFERHTDRSQTTATDTVPNATFLNGLLQYQRKAAAGGSRYATITTGCGGELSQITGVPCDVPNPALFGPSGFMSLYAPYVMNPAQYGGSIICPSDCSDFTNFEFNAETPFNENIYITRFDYTINSKNTVYVRGTLNNQSSVGAPTFPGLNNGLTTFDNSKGFSSTWNSVISPTLNNNFTGGLTRQAGSVTGTAAVTYSFGPTNQHQTSGASNQAIDTWSFTDNLSWIKGKHSVTAGINFSFIDNNLNSYNQVKPGTFGNEANFLVGDFAGQCALTCAAAIGPDWANVNSASTFETNLLDAIGGLNQYSVGLQWNKNGNLLPVGTPFDRIIRLDQYDFYLQDNWKVKPDFTLNYGVHWGIVTPPWEKNGNEVNWEQSESLIFQEQAESQYTSGQLPLLTGQLAGRANNLPDYYPSALNNWAPRVSFAYSPKYDGGILGALTSKGGPMAIRGGYALTFDHTGGALASNAATTGAIGLFTSESLGSSSFSINGVGKPAIPRVGGSGANLILPYSSFPVNASQNFTPPVQSGWGGPSFLAVDPNLRPPLNHQVNLTVSKELPGGFVMDVSYIGRFARGLFSVADMATPVNSIDPGSGQDYYNAVKTLITQYENNGVGSQYGPITAKNAAQATANVQPIPWIEHMYGSMQGNQSFQNWAQTGLGPGVAFTGCPTTTLPPCTAANGGTQKPDSSTTFPGVAFQNNTQAFYAVLNDGLVPGPNTPFVLTNVEEFYEQDNNLHVVTNQQDIYQSLFSGIGMSNYNAAQFTLKKRFSAGYTLTANYTWARSMDTTSAGESGGSRPGGSGSADQPIDPYHVQKNYAPSTFDRAGVFNGNFVAELPVGIGKPLFGNMPGYMNKIFGGWQVSGIYTQATGLPFEYQSGGIRYTMHYEGNDIEIPTAPQQYGTNYTPNANYTVPMVFWIKDQSESASCNLACAETNRDAASKDFTNIYPDGPVNRNYARGPGYWNLDASLMKNIKFGDKLTTRFEADAFNVMNHPSFQNPGTADLGIDTNGQTGTLGEITKTQGGNRVMQFQLRFQF